LVAYYGFEGNANSHNNLYNLTNLHTSGTAVLYGTGATANIFLSHIPNVNS
jgi:hypothetical protein